MALDLTYKETPEEKIENQWTRFVSNQIRNLSMKPGAKWPINPQAGSQFYGQGLMSHPQFQAAQQSLNQMSIAQLHQAIADLDALDPPRMSLWQKLKQLLGSF